MIQTHYSDWREVHIVGSHLKSFSIIYRRRRIHSTHLPSIKAMCTKLKNQEKTPHRVKYYKYAYIPAHLLGVQHCTFLVSGVSLYLLWKDWMAVEHHFPELISCFPLASFISVKKIKETMKNFKRQLLQNGDSIKIKNFVLM